MLEVKPFTPERTLLQWFNEREKIDFKPTYQRRSGLWSHKIRQLLINSILNQYDIPKIYLADFTYSETPIQESRKPFAIIDGKQRLQTLFDFFLDKLELGVTPVLIDGQEQVLEGLKYSDLKSQYPLIGLRYDKFVPTVMSVIADNLEQIQEMFIRLNTSISISGPEKRNAFPGPLPKIIRRISVHKFFREYARFSVDRGQDLNVAPKMINLEFFRDLVPMYAKDLDRFVLGMKDKKPRIFSSAEKEVEKNLDKLCMVFHKKDSLLGGQAQIITYYWFVRGLPEAKIRKVRSFLEHFEGERKRVKKLVTESGKTRLSVGDQELLTYNLNFRSPDAPVHQAEMIRILRKRFK